MEDLAHLDAAFEQPRPRRRQIVGKDSGLAFMPHHFLDAGVELFAFTFG
jgi:hypothetical protein